MYNFSSEGAYSDSEIPLKLVGELPEELSFQNLEKVTENIRA